jgi:hypothetical protein
MQICNEELNACKDSLGNKADEIISHAVTLHNMAGGRFTISPQTFLNFIQCYK